ncbi:hypothetical protein [Sulfurospirillum sp. 1612]|uniref:hypothetical protein n=1 Tax=Sulfurospirillum sp. 1612 TaxID=3094835 RepID=UPI002F939479
MNSRIRPYLDANITVFFETLHEATGKSYGVLFTSFLFDSERFDDLLESYYNMTPEELKSAFDLGPNYLKTNEKIQNQKTIRRKK